MVKPLELRRQKFERRAPVKGHAALGQDHHDALDESVVVGVGPEELETRCFNLELPLPAPMAPAPMSLAMAKKVGALMSRYSSARRLLDDA